MSKKAYKRIDKKTRACLDAISDLVKVRGEKVSYKGKKKEWKAAKKACLHWMYRKNKLSHLAEEDRTRPRYFKCKLCKAVFPIEPKAVKGQEGYTYENSYEADMDGLRAILEQAIFYSVALGGDSDDIRCLSKMKSGIPKTLRILNGISKEISKRDQYERQRASLHNEVQFGAYSHNYNR